MTNARGHTDHYSTATCWTVGLSHAVWGGVQSKLGRVGITLNLRALRRAGVVAGLVAVSLGSTSGHPANTSVTADVVCPSGLCTDADKRWGKDKIRELCGIRGGTGTLICEWDREQNEIIVKLQDIRCFE